MKRLEYRIVSATSEPGLEQAVMRLAINGFRPCGGVAIVLMTSLEAPYFNFHQAMSKETEEQETEEQ
jgi:hypothetical protein